MTDDEFNDILNQAVGMTNDQLSGQIASMTTLTQDEINAMAPTVDNMVQLLQFIQVVRGAANSNDLKAKILSNIDIYSNFLFTIIGKVVGGATSGGGNLIL